MNVERDSDAAVVKELGGNSDGTAAYLPKRAVVSSFSTLRYGLSVNSALSAYKNESVL